MKRHLTVATLALLTAACGARGDLRPAEGAQLPPPAYGAETRPTASDLLTPPPQARPGRVDELLTRSDERADDTFDLPPED